MATRAALSRAASAAASAAASDVVRHDDTRNSDARAPTAHGHAGTDLTSGIVAAARLPLVPNPPVDLTYAASLTPDAATGNYRTCTATGAVTLNAPTNPTNGQLLRIRFLASGAIRVITFAAALRLSTGIAGTLSIPSGKRGDVGLLYDTADAAWTVLAATAQL